MLTGSPRNQFCRSSTSCRTPAGPRHGPLRRGLRPAAASRLAQVQTWIHMYQDQAIVIGRHPGAHCRWMPAGASWQLAILARRVGSISDPRRVRISGQDQAWLARRREYAMP